MSDYLKLIINQINQIHTALLNFNQTQNLGLSDKDLHFYVFGLGAMGLFLIVHFLFKWLSKYSMTFISFVFTFVVLVGLALAIEIGQRVTQEGIMDFNDVVSGVYGFLVFFSIYLVFTFLWKFFNQSPKRRRR